MTFVVVLTYSSSIDTKNSQIFSAKRVSPHCTLPRFTSTGYAVKFIIPDNLGFFSLQDIDPQQKFFRPSNQYISVSTSRTTCWKVSTNVRKKIPNDLKVTIYKKKTNKNIYQECYGGLSVKNEKKILLETQYMCVNEMPRCPKIILIQSIFFSTSDVSLWAIIFYSAKAEHSSEMK